jgi:DNA-binding MarR family transcriptional regulator
MEENLFFKPTLLYKEYLILDMIAKDKSITQRMMSETLGVSVSMVNGYLDDLEERKLIRRKHQSKKTVEYVLTGTGMERRKVLNIGFLKSSHFIYESAKENIIAFLMQIHQRGFDRILLYGAGEVAEIFLAVLKDSPEVPVAVASVIDDDDAKQGGSMSGIPIHPGAMIPKIPHDGILVASYTGHDRILGRLHSMGYEESKILHFFE